MFDAAQQWVIIILSVAALAGALWGFVDAWRYDSGTFVAAGKQTKALWLVLLGAATLVAFVSLPFPYGRGGGIIGFLGIAAIAVIALYFATVRPVLRQHQPRRGGRGSSGRGSTGGW